MLRVIQNSSSAQAKSYYSTGDYYLEGQQELAGVWCGEGAKRLGLEGPIQRPAWDALCDNRHPQTGLPLTPRQKADRSVNYDFNFHLPKSASLLYAISKNERILDAFRASVNETMRDIESDMKTRVRAGGRNEERTTSNAVWGEFLHLTARPVNGIPDPHVHMHAVMFNCTFDEQEKRWKAAQFRDLKRDAPYYESLFHVRMSRRLAEMGLPIERTRKGWEIAGIAKSAIDKFSRRTKLIEEKAKELGITDPKEKETLGAATREHKQKDLTFNGLRGFWAARLEPTELAALETAAQRIGGPAIAEDQPAAGDALTAAAEHWFERKSVVPERQLLATALKQAVGKASVTTVIDTFKQGGFIDAERGGRRWITSREVLAEEARMIAHARDGRGRFAALSDRDHRFRRDWLNEGQQKAIQHVLSSHDAVIMLKGKAGVGKTTTLQETAEAIESRGRKVFAFAPSSDATDVLRREGFDAETVAMLLKDPRLQERIAGQVWIIDEAGLLGTRQMSQVFDLATQWNARVILTGDPFQHGSVERGAAWRLLETEAGVVPAEIKEIVRQKAVYRDAVKALSEGDVGSGLKQLDKLGWVHEVPDGEGYKMLTADYLSAINAGKSALVISPTHNEGDRISDEIRTQLQQAGKLSKEQRPVRVYENANLTLGERRDSLNYVPGDLVVFHQNAKGFKRGQRIIVGDAALPLDQADKFTVFHPNVLPVAPGETIRITHNSKTADGKHRLVNGALHRVKGFDVNGGVILDNGWTITKDGHFSHGYCTTSHASQGKTVDRVFIGMGSDSFPATSREAFYVSVSRGKKSAQIYTSNKEALREAVNQSDERLSATELVAGRARQRHMNTERHHEQLAVLADRTREARSRRDMSHER